MTLRFHCFEFSVENPAGAADGGQTGQRPTEEREGKTINTRPPARPPVRSLARCFSLVRVFGPASPLSLTAEGRERPGIRRSQGRRRSRGHEVTRSPSSSRNLPYVDRGRASVRLFMQISRDSTGKADEGGALHRFPPFFFSAAEESFRVLTEAKELFVFFFFLFCNKEICW